MRLSELENKELLLLDDGHCLRDQALSLCHQVNAVESKRFKATSLETLRHMVISQIGMTLMPKLSCLTHVGISYLPFISPKPTRTIGMIWRASCAKTILLTAIAEQTRKLMAKQKTVKVIQTSILCSR